MDGSTNLPLLCEEAAKQGSLPIFNWSRETHDCCDERETLTCAGAGACGHFDILKWARKNGFGWDQFACSNAAANGDLEMLKWAKDHFCMCGSEACAKAARNGQLEILRCQTDWLKLEFLHMFKCCQQ
jgi:hypothetical protein